MFTLANIKLEFVFEFLSQQFDDLTESTNDFRAKCASFKHQLLSSINHRMMIMIVGDDWH